MSGKVPLAAFCEEYDEDAHVILPDTRHSASSHRRASSSAAAAAAAPVVIDGASDSGYSSRTVTSSQSAVSGAKSPPLTLDTSAAAVVPTDKTSAAPTTTTTSPSTTTTTSTTPSTTIIPSSSSKRDPNRVHRRDRAKDRRSPREDHTAKMQVGSYPSGPYHGSSHRSSSRPRDTTATTTTSSSSRQYPGAYWDYDSAYYPSTGPSTPLDPRTMDYSYYAMSQPATSMHDYGLPPPPPPPPPPLPPSSSTTSSSHSSRYSLPASVVPDVHVSSSRPSARSSRSNSYHTNGSRPLSFHGMMPGGGGSSSGGSSSYYNPSHMARYDHGPPLSASAYANSPSFGPSTVYGQQPPYYSLADYGPPPPPEHRRERSMSRSREYPKGRRSSMYGSSGGVPVVDYEPAPSAYDDGEPLERGMSRDSRPPMSPHSSSFDHDEDYYRMPPPPLKHKSTPQIIQKRPDPPRKSATTTSIHSDRRNSRAYEMADLDAALPDIHRAPASRQPRYRRSRENLIPERSRSLRTTRRRPTAYHDSSTRPSRIAVEGARRRRAAVYNYDDEDDEDDDDDDDDDDGAGQIEKKQRDAENYQATKAKHSSSNGKAVPVPLTADALSKAKASQRAGSDSGSQKTRSSASDARTQSGSNVDSTTARQQEEENTNFVMSMNGITMSIPQEAVSSKKISLRTGDTGALELNIEGKRPKKYLTSGSEYTGAVARRELEDARRPRDSRRSDRASRRSSRSTYSGRFLA